jgi:hypothetical protein
VSRLEGSKVALEDAGASLEMVLDGLASR